MTNKNIIKEKEIKKDNNIQNNNKNIIKDKNTKNEEKKNDDDEMEELYKYDLINFNKTMQLLLKNGLLLYSSLFFFRSNRMF